MKFFEAFQTIRVCPDKMMVSPKEEKDGFEAYPLMYWIKDNILYWNAIPQPEVAEFMPTAFMFEEGWSVAPLEGIEESTEGFRYAEIIPAFLDKWLSQLESIFVEYKH